MKKPNITPGPWKSKNVRGIWRVYGNASGGHIAEINSAPTDTNPLSENEAKAIASLPELLEALEKAHQWTKALYAALPYDKGQEALRCHSAQLKLGESALTKAGYTF